METISSAGKLIDNTHTVKMTGSHYPWGLYIGELRHPDRGHLMPAVLPNLGAGFFIKHNDNIKSAVHLIEDMVVHFILATIERKRPIINVLDTSLNNPFVDLLQMSEICNINLQSSTEQFNAFNTNTANLIRHRNTEVLTSDVSSIAQYNEQCDPRAQESYIINIINFNDYIKNPDRLSGLSEILDNAEKVGIKFLFYINTPYLDNIINSIEDEKQRNRSKQLVKNIIQKLPTLSTTKHDIFFGENDNGVFTPLQSYIHKNGLTLELSSRGTNRHIFNSAIKDINDTIDELEKNNDRPFLKVEIGVSPNGKAKRYFELGESNEAYHAFIIGKTGTGKTVFLDHIIKGIALQNSPQEAELYLFDYKEGIGFAKYANLPHTRVLMLDHSNQKTIYTYIKQFQAMIAERGELFTNNGVEKISEYNEKFPNQPLSRVYLVIDEVQKLFKDDDDRVFSELIEDVARRGRSVGLTMIMATQTLSGYSIPDVVLSQFALKIAFRVDVQDSSSFFAIGNNSPIYLNKRECITNDKEGVVEGNKKVLVNAPVPDSVIMDLVSQYPNYNDKVIIKKGMATKKTEDEKVSDNPQQATTNDLKESHSNGTHTNMGQNSQDNSEQTDTTQQHTNTSHSNENDESVYSTTASDNFQQTATNDFKENHGNDTQADVNQGHTDFDSYNKENQQQTHHEPTKEQSSPTEDEIANQHADGGTSTGQVAGEGYADSNEPRREITEEMKRKLEALSLPVEVAESIMRDIQTAEEHSCQNNQQ